MALFARESAYWVSFCDSEYKLGDSEMKKSVLFLLLAICFTTVTACAGKEPSPETKEPDAVRDSGQNSHETQEPDASDEQILETADESEEENVEQYESVPYRLYPTSENAWVGDVMPMADENGLQVYYLYDTEHNGAGYHPI